jgi:hypothetical protein
MENGNMMNKTFSIFIVMIYFIVVSSLIAQENSLLEKIISIDIKEATQEEALEHLIKTHKIPLAYSNTFLIKDKKITLVSEKMSVKDILNKILEGTNLRIQSAEGNSIIIAPDRIPGSNRNSIKGKIIDAKTSEPIIAASVFLSGTTYGKATNKTGNYEIAGVPDGYYELVVSMVGYSIEKQNVSLKEDTDLVINVSLNQKDIEVSPVEVNAIRSEEWYDNLEIFKRIIIGKSEFSKECKIQNEGDIYFIENKPDSSFEAHTVKPLIVINKALGYKLECFLTKLIFNRKTSEALYSISTNFEELQTTDEDLKEEWKDNRVEAYKGSVIHFLVSLTKKKANSEGFRMYEGLQKTVIVNRTEGRRLTTWLPAVEIPEDLFITYLPDEKQYFLNVSTAVVYYKRQFSEFKVISKELNIDQHGYPQKDALYKVTGDWAEKGLADLLPRFYEKIYEKNK